MNISKLFFSALLACSLWNCNESVKSDNEPNQSKEVPAVLNALSKKAAIQAGLVVVPTGEIPVDIIPNPNTIIDHMRAAGVCEGVIELYREIFSGDSLHYDKFLQIGQCLEQHKADLQSENIATMSSAFDVCVCNGQGSFFGNIALPKFNPYTAPKSPAGQSYQTPQTTPSSYEAPTSPASSGYETPQSPAGKGYSSPSL